MDFMAAPITGIESSLSFTQTPYTDILAPMFGLAMHV